VATPHDEADLERALAFLYQQWKLLGYRSRDFYGLFTPYSKRYKGAIAAVQYELRKTEGSSFEFLKRNGKLVFSVERLVVKETWSHLFTHQDRSIAALKLEEGAGASSQS
jgi:hypothetical protein